MTSSKKRLAIIKGDTDQPLWAIELYWFLFLAARKREYGEKYAIEVITKPSRDHALKVLSEVDAAIFYGHGDPASIRLGSERLTTDDVMSIKSKRSSDMDFVKIACCDTCSDDAWVNAWLSITSDVSGYCGLTYDIRHPFKIPKPQRFTRQ